MSKNLNLLLQLCQKNCSSRNKTMSIWILASGLQILNASIRAKSASTNSNMKKRVLVSWTGKNSWVHHVRILPLIGLKRSLMQFLPKKRRFKRQNKKHQLNKKILESVYSSVMRGMLRSASRNASLISKKPSKQRGKSGRCQIFSTKRTLKKVQPGLRELTMMEPWAKEAW